MAWYLPTHMSIVDICTYKEKFQMEIKRVYKL